MTGARSESSAASSAHRRKALVGLAVGMPVSVFFLWLAARDSDLGSVRRTLEDARPGLVAPGIVAMLVVYAFQSARWRMVAGTPQVGFPRFYEMVVSGVACNNVLPARLGDVLRARWLGLEARIAAGRAFGTVVLDRGCDVAALFLLLVVGLGAVASAAWLVRITVTTAVGLLALAAVIFFARVYTNRRERERHGRRLLRRLLRDAVETLAEPMGRRRPVFWLALSLGAWGTWAIGAALIARSLGIELSLTEALFVTAVMNLGVAIPSSPGFVGTYEWLGVASLGLLGVASADALAFSILLHASWYVPTTLGGGALLGARGVRRIRRRHGDEAAADWVR